MAVLLKNILHVLLFLLAGLFFHLGLVLGLQVSPALGTVIWVITAAILAFNLAWIISRWS